MCLQQIHIDATAQYGILTVIQKAGPEAGVTQRYTVGSLVQLHSALSDEIFSGVITAVGADDVIVKLGTGARLRVFVAQLRDRRCVIRMNFVFFLARVFFKTTFRFVYQSNTAIRSRGLQGA
jgi:hypothetical protein